MPRKSQDRIYSKTRNRGRFASFTVHLILLLVAFLPFLSFQAPEEPTKEALVIQFDYPFNQYVAPEKFEEPKEVPMSDDVLNDNVDSKMSGSEAGGNETHAEPMESRPMNSAPAALSTPSTPTAIRNTPNPIRTTMSDVPLPMPKIYTKSAWESVEDVSASEVDNVGDMRIIDSGTGFGDVPGEGAGTGEDDSNVSSEGFGTSPGGQGGTGTGTGNTSGAGSGPGGGTGSGNAGNKTGIGNNGTGFSVGLDGLLNRKLIRRANVGSLAVKEGKIAMYICVDQQGKVVTTKYDVVSSSSNLKDPEFIKRAEEIAKSYLWAPDPTAPPKQCGKMTFIFKLPK